MALLPILTAPHPILSKTARTVEAHEFGPALLQHLSDMAQTMYAAPGVGLAAPQVGDSRRIVVVDSGVKPEDGGTGLIKLVNPIILSHSSELISWPETCLSVPDLEVVVDRFASVTLGWQDAQTGEQQQLDLHEFEAVIVQHELDHLMGTVLLDRVSPFRRRRWIRAGTKRMAVS